MGSHHEIPRPSTVKIAPGEHYVTTRGDVVITTTLGSCVAACIRDAVAGVGGMNHFMLPSSDSGAWGSDTASLRFGNFAMERLVNEILKRGGRRDRLEVKAFGGGDVLGIRSPVGKLNADFIGWYLREEGMRLAASQLGGHVARMVQYFPLTGRARVLEIPIQASNASTQQERQYRDSLRAAPVSADIELFD